MSRAPARQSNAPSRRAEPDQLPAVADDSRLPAELTGRVAPTALEAATRAELDVSIATARAFPRDYAVFMRKAKAMVECDPDLAAECTYILPKKNQDGDPISGPSVRLSEIVALCWGNLRVATRVIDDDGRMVTVQGVAHDLEANVMYSDELKVGVTYSPNARYNAGARYSDDMVKTTMNAAASKVRRNAIFRVIPLAFVHIVQDHADGVARGDVASLPKRVEKALAWFAKKGVAEPVVLAALGLTARDEFTIDTLRTLNGFKTSVNDGHSSLAEIFAPPVTAATPGAPAAHTAGALNTPAPAAAPAKKTERLAQSLAFGGADAPIDVTPAPAAPAPREPGEDG